MKKTWLFGMAFTFGLSTLPNVTSAQYASAPYGNGALAPSGYAVNEGNAQTDTVYPSLSVPAVTYGQGSGVIQQPTHSTPAQSSSVQYSQAQYPQYATAQSVQSPDGRTPSPQFAAPGIHAQLVGYPQELVPPPAYEAQPAPEKGWVGPNNGQYQAQPIPVPNAIGQADAANSILAPTAMNAGGNGGGIACGEPIYPAMSRGWLAGRTSVPGKAWFAGGGALLFRRVDDHNVALTYSTAMPTENALSTGDARQTRLPGFEVFMGRYINCGRNALMLNYWGLYPENESATIQAAASPSAYRSRYNFNGIDMPTRTAYDWYDGAISHRITRSSQYHNVEANLLGFALGGASRTWNSGGGCGDCGSCGSGCAAFTGPCGVAPNACGSRLNLTWLGGFRWFRFTDNLQYAASDLDYNYNGGTDDLYYDNNVRNDLIGFQLGGAGTYCLGKRCNLYALSKAGIYNNHSRLYTRIGRSGAMPTTAVVNSANIYDGQEYMVDASQNNAAFLGEIGTGVGVRVSKGWSANVGYRVMGASGVATAVNTIPIEMLHLGNVADYNTTSSLLLHGVTIGGMYNF